MKKHFGILLIIALAVSISFAGCFKNAVPNSENETTSQPTHSVPEHQGTGNSENENSSGIEGEGGHEPTDSDQPPLTEAELLTIKPNENGKIMVVMFHNFIQEYTSGDKEYTTTFGDFRKLLEDLYDRDYRLISLKDMLDNNISVPAGCIPIVFTFDDGTSGQFNLVEKDGELVAGSNSAVGIMEEFNKTHPDFGLKGTFYVNLGLSTFRGEGTLEQRLKYLIDKGFEIGNHTFTHVHLNEIRSSEIIQKEIGGNQKKMYELIPGYTMMSFSLPYGQPAKELVQYVAKGKWEGVEYENLGIMEVGWDPSVSPISKRFNPLSIHRVRASGIKPVDMDLGWWLDNMSRGEQYISDGNPDTVTVPESKKDDVDPEKLGDKKLVTY